MTGTYNLCGSVLNTSVICMLSFILFLPFFSFGHVDCCLKRQVRLDIDFVVRVFPTGRYGIVKVSTKHTYEFEVPYPRFVKDLFPSNN